MGEKKGIDGLIERFSDLPDVRVEGRTDHALLDIVVLALCAVMSGAEGWDDIEDWGARAGGMATTLFATARWHSRSRHNSAGVRDALAEGTGVAL